MKSQIGLVVGVAQNLANVRINEKYFHAHIRAKIKQSQELLVGDKVKVSILSTTQVVIEAILPRKNQLYRPKIANIDQGVILNSLTNPQFHTLILNKLLTIFNFYQIPTVLVFSKVDLVSSTDKAWEKVRYYQKLKYECYFISNVSQTGIKDVSKIFNHKISLLTGLSGVGKSSLLNSLDSSLKLATNEISLALKHGKHTTTSTRLYFLKQGVIADSPGFMVLNLKGLSKQDISANFPVVNQFFSKCKFADCLHQNEPGCSLLTTLEHEKDESKRILVQVFYQDYCKILAELPFYID